MPLVQMWLEAFTDDFRARLLALLAGAFRTLEPATALSLLQPRLSFSQQEADAAVAGGVSVTRPAGEALTGYDLKRLQVRGSCSCCCIGRQRRRGDHY
jgi:N-acetyltransferase 10